MDDATGDTIAGLAELLTQASWRLRRNERKVLEPFGLTFARARALRLLVEQGVMRVGDLAERLEIVPRSATTRVDDLERAGLAVRRMDPGDRRSILVEATELGHELVGRLAEERRSSAEALFAPLSDDQRVQLAGLLRPLTCDRAGARRAQRARPGTEDLS